MPNRAGAGYMPDRVRGYETRRNTQKAADAVRHADGAPAAGTDADLTDAGDFGRDYEQWSKGDLYNRAAQLDLRGRKAMTKERLIAAIRDKEAKPARRR